MKRPRLSKKQKAHAKMTRALLRLRRAAVACSVLKDASAISPTDPRLQQELARWETERDAASDAYANSLPSRERLRLLAGWGAELLRKLRAPHIAAAAAAAPAAAPPSDDDADARWLRTWLPGSPERSPS